MKKIIIFLLLISTVSFLTCSKRKKGVLEIKEVRDWDNFKWYKVIPFEHQDSYPEHQEFIISKDYPTDGITTIGFYWPDKSPHDLGYKKTHLKNDDDYISERGINYPGERGHWKDDVPPVSSSNGGSSSASCPYGDWKMDACGGGKYYKYHFGTDGKGYQSTPDCNDICTPITYNFTFTVSGNKILYEFTAPDHTYCNGVDKGAPVPPTGQFSMTFSCSSDGNSLTLDSKTFSR